MDTTDYSQDGLEFPDITEFLRRIAPPKRPDQAISLAPGMARLVAQWDPTKTVSILAGMMTDPRYHAHNIRLDFAIRIVLTTSHGLRRPKQRELDELLNSQSSTARISYLEDPIEDFFVEVLPTHDGEFLLLSGMWEKASVHTELLREAFRHLPDAPPKAATLRSTDALLRLSTAVVKRAGLQRGTVGGGTPAGTITIPSDARLSALSARMRFIPSDLSKIEVCEEDLAPFFLKSTDLPAISDNEPGDSPLEFRPLIKTKHGFLLAAPSNISTAVRAFLINTVHDHHMETRLQFNLLKAKADYLNQFNFRPIPSGEVQRGDDHLYCDTTIELSAGRFLHVILSVDGFRGWPYRAFGAMTQCSEEWAGILLDRMRAAKSHATSSPSFVEGMTLLLASGWGAGRGLAFTPDDDLLDWGFLAVEPADIATISCCEDGALSDIWRMQKQLTLVESQGFHLITMNGFLNLFHWWRTTDHALFPPSQIDATPPLSINFDTNLLFDARQEALQASDRRALRDETGRWHLVARLERKARYQALERVYASLDDVQHAILSGVVVGQSSQWWIKLENTEQDPFQDIFETWKTALIWAGQVMPLFMAKIKPKQVVREICFRMKIEPPPEGGYFDIRRPPADSEIDNGLELKVDRAELTAHLTLKPSWFAGFYRPDNYAERALALTLLAGASQLFGVDQPIKELSEIVLSAAGSLDFRHRHAFQIQHAVDHLVADGLVKPFSEIPISAAALAKCGSVWTVHPRSEGVKIEGKSDCLTLIRAFVERCQVELLRDLTRFDRTQFVVAALEGLQSAIAEESHWRRSARALRAIHGVERDFDMSLSRVTAANGVIRANSMLVEMASVEALQEGGRPIGKMDLEELQARALQIFQTADNYPAFVADRIEPIIHLSPTGDILFQHSFHEAAIESSAKLRHARERVESSDEYLTRFQDKQTARPTDAQFERAIEAEYGVKISVLGAFSSSMIALARRRKSGVMLLRRSDLITELLGIHETSDVDFPPLIDRFTLPSRRNWLEIPPGCTSRDFDLSKFDRRFSLIARPLLALSCEQDPRLAIAPALIERTIVHNLCGAVQGALQNDFWISPEMKSYTGASGAREGVEFNDILARRLANLGLRATASVTPWACLNIRKTAEIERLGDVDVLVVSENGRSVWICEAKDLKLCRTLGEAAQRLSDYRGQISKGKPDKLLRHLNRVDYFRRNSSQLARCLGLRQPPEVHGLIIVNSPQPMQQLTGEYSKDSTVVMMDEIEGVPWDTGWQ
ncbi:MAG: hypothetical protein QM576_14435 [Rhodopseudomonas sp.]|uniref:hypothetical protein n=1 Tax=Rhodopseudomonas sp. TaxID=1078 RepID=UPI0039E5DAFF